MLHPVENVLKRVCTVTSAVALAFRPTPSALLSRRPLSTPPLPKSAARMHASSHGGMTTPPATLRNAVRTTSAENRVSGTGAARGFARVLSPPPSGPLGTSAMKRAVSTLQLVLVLRAASSLSDATSQVTLVPHCGAGAPAPTTCTWQQCDVSDAPAPAPSSSAKLTIADSVVSAVSRGTTPGGSVSTSSAAPMGTASAYSQCRWPCTRNMPGADTSGTSTVFRNAGKLQLAGGHAA